MENVRIETAAMISNKIKTLKGIADQLKVSVPTLRKIKQMDESVSLKKVEQIRMLLETI